MRWAASDVSPSSHLAFHIPNTCRVLFVLCCVLGLGGLLLCCVFGFLFCKCFGIPNSPRSLDLDDRQGLIASSAMQQKKKKVECKGASGTLPCMLCSNVVSRNSELDAAGLIPHSAQSLRDVVLHTDESIQSIVTHLATQKALRTKKAFSELERNIGFNYVPNGVLDLNVFKVSGIQFDWCHCYMVQGIFQLEAGLLMNL